MEAIREAGRAALDSIQMKCEVEIEGRIHSVELQERGGRIYAKVGDRDYELEVLKPEEGIYLIFAGDDVYEARVWPDQADRLSLKVLGHSLMARVLDRKHRRSSSEQFEEGRRALVAPMPGKVVRVLLKPGDPVAAGQGVVVVEAMKMQNEIKSPKSGRVVEIRVAEGSAVSANQVLAVVE